MPVSLQSILGRTKTCLVSYTAAGAAEGEPPIEFGVRYYPEAVTGSVLVQLLHLQELGPVLQNANTDPGSALKTLKGTISSLADTLAGLVEWQDLVDDAGAHIEPSAAFFADKKFEFQLAYVNAIMADRQVPTTGSDESSSSGSSQKVSSVAAQPATPSSGQPATSESHPGS
jgi:hypothetical protein